MTGLAIDMDSGRVLGGDNIKKPRAGDRIFSRRHRIGEIHVDIAGTKVLVGRAIKRDGSPGRREVVVAIEEITSRWPLLPGMRD